MLHDAVGKHIELNYYRGGSLMHWGTVKSVESVYPEDTERKREEVVARHV